MEIISQCELGIPIYLDVETEEIVYKDNRVPFKDIKDAHESGYDTVKLAENLFFRRRNGFCDFACLKLTEEKVKQLIKTTTWKLLKK